MSLPNAHVAARLMVAMVSAAALCLPSAGPGVASLYAAEASLLNDESLVVSNSFAGGEDITGLTEGSFSCGSDFSQLQMSITGNAYGPYPGTFSQTIDAQVVDGLVQTFDVTFEILSGDTTITGAAQYVGSEAGANCYELADEEGSVFQFGAGSGGSGYDALPLEYSATIDDGVTQVADVGPVQAGVNLYCAGSPDFTSNCDVATTILAFQEPLPPPPPPSDPPVIIDVSFSTTTIENGPDPVTMTVTATITDDIGVLEGGCVEEPPEEGGGTSCSGSEITFFPPRGNVYGVGWLAHVTGDVYQAVVAFPAYAALGTWTAAIAAVDTDYQYTGLGAEDLAALGFPSSIEVTGIDDITGPTLVSLGVPTPAWIDVSDPDNSEVVIDAVVTDDLSGYVSGTIGFASPTASTETCCDIYYVGIDPIDGIHLFLGPDATAGTWTPYEAFLEDVVGNRTYLSAAELPAISFEVRRTVTGDLQANVPFSNAEGLETPPLLEVELTSPTAGSVTMLASAPSTSDPSGFVLLGQQVDITAPAAPDAAHPLVITFTISHTFVPAGVDPSTLAVFRNGALVATCTGSPGVASPDPCVSDRHSTDGGDGVITVLTTHASAWNFGVRDSVPSAMATKQDALAALEAIEGATGKAARTVQQAIVYLRASLTESWWLDADHLDPKLGSKVFDQDLAAAKLLMSKEVAGLSGVTGVLDLIVQADRMLAQTALDDATNAGGKPRELQAAMAAISRGDAAVGTGAYYSAIDSYKSAWMRAQAAGR